MSFKTKLKTISNKKLEDHAAVFAAEIKPALEKSAEAGYTGATIKVTGREDGHLLTRKPFLEKLEELLDGCKVEINQKEHTNFINQKWYTHEMSINWRGADADADDTAETEISDKEGN